MISGSEVGADQPSKQRRLEAGAHDEMVEDPLVRVGGDVDPRGTDIDIA